MATDVKLWIGGSSGLARTYFNAFSSNDDWILTGREEVAPEWLEQHHPQQHDGQASSAITRKAIPYVPCDLSTLAITTKRKSRTNRLAEVMRRLERAVSFLDKNNHHNGNNDLLNLSASSLNSSFATAAATDGDRKRSRTNNGTNKQQRTISHIVIGIRPPLVTHRNNQAADRYCHDLMTGMSLLLHALVVKHSVTTVLHVSSIAAVDHVQRQHLRSVREIDPTYAVLSQPYDRFKRGCEELVELVCQQHSDKKMNNSRQQIQQQSPNRSISNNSNNTISSNNIRFTNLRLGAIFSDSPTCIQCSALALQCYTGPYLRVPIDCNSSRNAASLIHLMLHSPHHHHWRPVYYYTRCFSSYPRQPVPYGEYLLAYRRAYGLQWLPLFLPAWWVEWCFVRPFHWCTVVCTVVLRRILRLPMPPFLESIDYLLQVTLDEHTFDMRETIKDFPMIRQAEESMDVCFRRRRAQLEADAAAAASKKRRNPKKNS